MPIVYVGIGIAIMILLMVVLKVNAFISLIITSLLVGIMEGLPPVQAIASVENGLGSTLGKMTMVICFGVMLGKLLTDSGAAQRISTTMINLFGRKRVQLAAVATAFILGIVLLFDTGIIVLLPLILTIAAEAEVPILYVGMPVMAALMTIHGLVPPHPMPTAIANIYHANLGVTMFYGFIIAIPAIVVSGLLYTRCFKKKDLEVEMPKERFTHRHFEEAEMPGFGISIFTAVIPVILIGVPTIFNFIVPKSPLTPLMKFIGEPNVALLVSVIVAVFTFGLARGKKMDEIMKTLAESTRGIIMILLVIGGGGAFGRVLADSHVDKYFVQLMQGTSLSPLIFAWLFSAILRAIIGSATVAGLTAAGILAPVVAMGQVSPELMVLATGSGSIAFSNVSDSGFWIAKEFFNLSVGKTFKTWTAVVTIAGLVGLMGVLVLNIFVK